MKLFKSVDEKLSEIGFEKSYESDSGVDYEKYVEGFNFVHKVSIVRKSSGKQGKIPRMEKARRRSAAKRRRDTGRVCSDNG